MPNAERARPVDRFRFAYSIKSISQLAIVDTSASDFAASPDNRVIISPHLSNYDCLLARLFPGAIYFSRSIPDGKLRATSN